MMQFKSPFKFLDAYNKSDRDIFFGREVEIDKLYELVYETKLILVYGQSGTGKTSLIQCGLSNRFKASDWFDIYIRQNGNINDALRNKLRQYAKTPLTEDMSIPEMVESLFLDFFKPIYLIFDQFEEFYILGTPEERATFIQDIAALYHTELNCKLIFIMREEYIARLYDFEKQLPELFDKRLRIEAMSYANVRKVIAGSAQKFNISIPNPEGTIDAIIDNISDGKSGIQLSYLQVYLDRLYQEATQT